MHTFFHGWRRKAGVVSLVIVITFAVSWIRSYLYHEGFALSVSGRKHTVAAWNGDLIWMAFNSNRTPGQYVWSNAISAEIELRDARPIGSHRWVIPHLAIVVPMTLLSAYLILWKPRKVTGDSVRVAS